MPCPKSTFFGRVEVEFWGARAEGSGHARAGVGITSQVDAKVEEYGKKFSAGAARPWVGSSPYAVCDSGVRVMSYAVLEV